MEPLKEKYRPSALENIQGQPATAKLMALVANPRPCCILLTGPTGTGKSTAAQAMARELGCYNGGILETAYTVCAADMDAAAVDYWLGPASPFRLIAPGGWHVLIIEELETVSQAVAIRLKDGLERKIKLMGNVIVIATSNSTEGIPRAVLDRFRRYDFDGGLKLAQGMAPWLAAVWQIETHKGNPLPSGWERWGWDYDCEEFSARRAVDCLEEAVEEGRLARA